MPRSRFLVQPAPETSLGAPRFDDDQRRVYGRALDALAGARVPFLVGGALALNHYTGIWRDTKDLDLFIKPEDVDAALASLSGAGFETERVYASWLSKAIEGDLFVDLIHRNANGLHPVEDAWFDRAPAGECVGRPVRFVAAEEIFLSKSFVGGRYRYDGADLFHLVYATRGGLDWDLLIEEAGEHAGLVLAHLHAYRWAYPGFAHYVPDRAMERLAERAAADARAPPTPFRGRLYDRAAFSVDVEGWGLPDEQEALVRRLLGPQGEWGTGVDEDDGRDPEHDPSAGRGGP